MIGAGGEIDIIMTRTAIRAGQDCVGEFSFGSVMTLAAGIDMLRIGHLGKINSFIRHVFPDYFCAVDAMNHGGQIENPHCDHLPSCN